MYSQLKKNLTGGLLTTMVFACPFAVAEAQYPPPFESKIIYQDADYIAEHDKSKETSKAPSVAPQSPQSTDTSLPDESESKYPEPFQSKIIYQDTDYINQQSKRKIGSSSTAKPSGSVASSSQSQNGGATASSPSDSSENEQYLLGLIVLAVLFGLVYFGGKLSSASSSTSVARYIARRDTAAAATGVAKYLHYRGY